MFKIQEEDAPNIKNFERGGRFGGPKFCLCRISLRAFFAPDNGAARLTVFCRSPACPGFGKTLCRKHWVDFSFPAVSKIRSRPGKPNQRKGQNQKFMNFAHFCECWCFSSGKQARFTLNFCSGMPLRKVHELTFLCVGLPGPLLIKKGNENSAQSLSDRSFWKSLRVVDARGFRSWMSAPKCLFSFFSFQDFLGP